MKTSDFYFDLPKEFIAQTPTEPRDHAKLLVYDRNTKTVAHRHFYDLPEYLKKGDCLVINETRVLPARLIGERKDTGSFIEFLLLPRKRGCVGNSCPPREKGKTGSEFYFRQRT